MTYSKAHYRMLADYGGYDTPEAAEARRKFNEVSDQVRQELHERFPVITTDNFDAADEYRTRRTMELRTQHSC